MVKATKSVGRILADNICTVFNLLNFGIALALAAVGAGKNMLFIFVVIINTVVGIVQEIRAKRRVERLSLLSQPLASVLSEGEERRIKCDDVKAGDIIVLTAGASVCTDCVIKSGSIEADESVLTGESEPVVKKTGDRLLSGSSIISGKCFAQAECTTAGCFTSKMVDEVRRIRSGDSEILYSMKKVTKLTGYLIVPLGLLLFAQAFFMRGMQLDSAVISTSAGLLGMLPKGLVLLISIGLAAGVVRLSKKNVLVRDLHSLENLARCDVLCLDKTGTLTDGKPIVESVRTYIDAGEFNRLMASYLNNTADNNATFAALNAYFPHDSSYDVVNGTAFSSERKKTSVTLSDGRCFCIGAPERVCTNVPSEARELMAQGKRVLLAAISNAAGAPAEDAQLAGMIVIADKLRKNAVQTVKYFYEQGVDIKIISGDNPLAAAAVAASAGVQNAEKCIDVSLLSDSELEEKTDEYVVFGRVTPEQKRRLVAALQKKGHAAAMIGDGVNDLLAMRCANCSAAIGTGSDAAKQTAQLVLVDSDFAVLKDVISEGRRVINNMGRAAGVFFIKTIYSVLLCILCCALNIGFPFIPIQITLTDVIIEAFPAFMMSFERSGKRAEGVFLNRAVQAAFPNAAAIFICCALIMLTAPHFGIDGSQSSLLMYLCVGTISLFGLAKACLPFNGFRFILFASAFAAFFGAALFAGPIIQLPRLTLGGMKLLSIMICLGLLSSVLISAAINKKLNNRSSNVQKAPNGR